MIDLQVVKTWLCRKCGETKPVSKFRIRRGVHGGFHIENACSACRGKRECASLKLEMIRELGGKCACCGESHPQFLTLEHINGRVAFYGRKYGKAAHRIQSNTYVEIRKAKNSGWDRTQYELLCMNCNHARGHYGQCPHRAGITAEQVIASLEHTAKGIGFEFRRSMVEGGKVTRFKPGFDARRPSKKEVAAVLKELS